MMENLLSAVELINLDYSFLVVHYIAVNITD